MLNALGYVFANNAFASDSTETVSSSELDAQASRAITVIVNELKDPSDVIVCSACKVHIRKTLRV